MKWLHIVSVIVLILILALLYGLQVGDGDPSPAAGAPAASDAPRSYHGLGMGEVRQGGQQASDDQGSGTVHGISLGVHLPRPW